MRWKDIFRRKQRKSTKLNYAVNYGLKALVSLLFIIGLFVVAKKFLPADMQDNFAQMIKPLDNHPVLILSIFFVSESLLGLLFPDVFLAWAASQANNATVLISIMGVLSYAGGIISFLIGRWIGDKRVFERIVRNVRSKYTHMLQKWGGFFIVLAALTPIPFSPVCMLCGSLGFPFRKFLIYSLSRIIRILAYGLVMHYGVSFI